MSPRGALAASGFHGKGRPRVRTQSRPAGGRLSPSPSSVPGTRFPQRPGWPDPQSQSFSRSYGSNLPTSLTYISLSTRGFLPWRPAADMGTHRPETGVPREGSVRAGAAPRTAAAVRSSRPPRNTPCSYLPRMFHGPAVVRGTPQEPRRSTADRVTNTLSHCEWLLGSRRLKQKRKLFPGPPPMDASWFPLPGSCTRRQT